MKQTHRYIPFFLFLSITFNTTTPMIPDITCEKSHIPTLAANGIFSLFLSRELYKSVSENRKAAAAVILATGVLYCGYKAHKNNSLQKRLSIEYNGLKNFFSENIQAGMQLLPLAIQTPLRFLFNFLVGDTTKAYLESNKKFVAGALLIYVVGRTTDHEYAAGIASALLFSAGYTKSWLDSYEIKHEKRHTENIDKHNATQQQLAHIQDGQALLAQGITAQGEKIREEAIQNKEEVLAHVEKQCSALSSQITHVDTQLTDMEDHIKKGFQGVGSQIEDLSKQVINLPQTISALSKEIAEIKNIDGERDTKVEQLLENLNTLSKNATTIENKFNVVLESIGNKVDQLCNNTKKEFDETNTTLGNLQNTVTKIASTTERINSQNESQGQELIVAQGKINQLLEISTEQNELLSSLKKAQEILISKVDLETNNIKNNVDILVAKLETAKEKHEELTKTFFERLDTIEEGLQKVESKVSTLETGMKEVSTQVSSINHQLGSMTESQQKLSNNQDELLSQFVAFKEDCRKQFDALKEIDRKKTEDIEALRKQLAQEAHTLKKKVEQVNHSVQKQDETIKDIQTSFEQIGTALIQEIRQSRTETLTALQEDKTNSAPSVPLNSDYAFSRKKQIPLTTPKPNKPISLTWNSGK